MSDAPAPTTTPEPTTVAPPAETPPERTVPYDRFVEVNQKAKESASELKALQTRLQELEDKDKSELERERTQRERLQQELQARDTRLTQLERGSWVRDAANEHKFHDPADAVALVDLSKVESEADAKREVKRIASDKKHLVRQEQETPQIGQVLQNGAPTPPTPGAPQADQESAAFLDELKKAASDGWSSTSGLLDR